MVPQGGFPTELNLSRWADLVQDTAGGLQALPPRLSLDLGSQVIALLQLLEVATGVGFCHHCCHPRPRCTCTGASHHVVEPDCPAGSRVWSDLLWRSNRSKYPHGRYAWICGASPRPHPSRFLHLEHTSSGGPSAPRATGIPTIPASRGEGHPNESRYRKAGSGAAGSGAAGPTAAGSSDGATLVPATPILQAAASSRSQPATPYQQAVQPPSKPKGRGVTFDSSADKLLAAGSQDADGHGRQRTQGRDDNTRPARGTHEGSSVRMTSKQTPCQGGECPSGAPNNVPPASAPVSTPPQSGGGVRASPKDPLRNASRYRSAGWRKDLEHVLKIYCRHNVASFKEAEWSKMKEKFFTYLLQRKEKWRDIKENHPMKYMPYMEDHFYAATGLRLNGLKDFTGWIERGSYYHGLVARQGHLHLCPHLAGATLPRWPQTMPSESCQVSQRKPETPATSSSAPGIEASTPQGATADVPAPMETGGAGDSQSWAEQVEVEDNFKRDSPAKCRRSQSRRREDRPTFPFLLQDEEGRRTSAQELYRHSGQQPLARHNETTMGITHLHPEVLLREARSLGNQVLCMIAEYHLTSHAQGSLSLSLVLPEAVRDLLPPIEDYIGGGAFCGTRDVKVVERAKTLQIATWLHHLDMAVEGDQIASQTLEAA